MAGNVDGLRLRRTFGRHLWEPPTPAGPDGWCMVRRDRSGSVIVTCAPHELQDGTGDVREYVHASIAWADRDPTYADLVRLHRAVWGETGWAVLVFAPAADHVNIHEHALHLFGRLDGSRMHPDFGRYGTI
jgi:hypothetical protein